MPKVSSKRQKAIVLKVHLLNKQRMTFFSIFSIVSHGLGCGRKNSPGFYTRISPHLNWLCKTAKDEGEILSICSNSNVYKNQSNNNYFNSYNVFYVCFIARLIFNFQLIQQK